MIQENDNAMQEILSNQISLTESDLIRETAKLFGYALSKALDKVIESV